MSAKKITSEVKLKTGVAPKKICNDEEFPEVSANKPTSEVKLKMGVAPKRTG